MQNELGFEVLNWCAYCKSGIHIGEAYVVDKEGNIYHPECYSIKNTYCDSFGDEDN